MESAQMAVKLIYNLSASKTVEVFPESMGDFHQS